MESVYEVAFYHEHVLVKEPGTDKETPWHHDQSYYPIDGEKVCSIWMPVDPVPSDTCVQFIAGSHKWGWFEPIKFETERPYQIIDKENDGKVYQKVPDVAANKDKYSILHWDVQAYLLIRVKAEADRPPDSPRQSRFLTYYPDLNTRSPITTESR
ncbi:hypothetical protein AVEN_184149-1 [Araneus ventricosus]|uniref:Phytanoyl-CoA dioxygenase domain-containing protein 1 n=1 Tax=Araneus ventricosus TaxID=182803 RepID=A0A4Y2JI10_ARAVE|nr:hypothetical protein AVEN_184149-1 [Araneus ventricosus]